MANEFHNFMTPWRLPAVKGRELYRLSCGWWHAVIFWWNAMQYLPLLPQKNHSSRSPFRLTGCSLTGRAIRRVFESSVNLWISKTHKGRATRIGSGSSPDFLTRRLAWLPRAGRWFPLSLVSPYIYLSLLISACVSGRFSCAGKRGEPGDRKTEKVLRWVFNWFECHSGSC